MPTDNSRLSVPAFTGRKGQGPPLVVLTAYDVPTTLAAEAGVPHLKIEDGCGETLSRLAHDLLIS